MNRFKNLALATLAVAGLASYGTASALTWFEAPPGAGELIATAQITSGLGLPALDSIQGVLNTVTLVDELPRNEVDVYRIYVDDYMSFSARTVSSNPDDTALFLFDKAGKGVYMNDDNGVDLLSSLPTGGPLVNDYYYIAVAIGGFSAWDAASGSVFLSGGFTDVLGGDPAAGAFRSPPMGTPEA